MTNDQLIMAMGNAGKNFKHVKDPLVYYFLVSRGGLYDLVRLSYSPPELYVRFFSETRGGVPSGAGLGQRSTAVRTLQTYLVINSDHDWTEHGVSFGSGWGPNPRFIENVPLNHCSHLKFRRCTVGEHNVHHGYFGDNCVIINWPLGVSP